MKKHLASLSLVVAGLCAVPSLLRADDAVPPKPPGGDKAPADNSATGTAKPGSPGGGGGRPDPAERLKRMTEELGLTQDQQDKIKAIVEKNASQFKDLMSKGRENLTEDDKNKIRGLVKSQLEEISTVLTPEQKQKFQAAMEKRRAAGGGPGAGAGAPKQ